MAGSIEAISENFGIAHERCNKLMGFQRFDAGTPYLFWDSTEFVTFADDMYI
jgi:hypothetical protein